MRILTLTTSYPDGPEDWRGGFVAALNQALEERGHETVTVTPGPGTLFHGDGVVETLRRRPWLAAQIPPGMARLALGARREVTQCDVILSHWLVPCGLVGAALRKAPAPKWARSRPGPDWSGGPRHVSVVHGGGLRLLDRLPEAVARRTLAGIAAGTDRFQVVAPWMAARLKALHPPIASSVDVDPMGVVLPTDKAAPRPPPPLRVLYVGRLVQRKGVATLLEAVAAVPEATLTIVGDGPERARLETAGSLVGERVHFLGARSPQEVLDLHGEHHVIAAPSLPYPRGGEGTPTAVLDAMAAGLVPLGSRTGGLADLLASGEHGVLVPSDNPDALAAALRRLADTPETLADLSRSARAVTREYAWPQSAARLEARLRDAHERVA